MTKKLLLVDMDDTICNASESYNIALSKCYEFLNKKYPLINKKLFFKIYREAREQIHSELSGTASMHNRFLYFQRIFELFGLTLEPDVLDDITDIFWNVTYKKLKLYYGVKETLRLAKENNIRIGVISDLIAQVQIKKLKKLKIAKYIDFIVTSEEAGKEKPHQSIFLLALEKANCLPKETIMVGDSIKKDIFGAKHLGITSILFSRTFQKKNSADFVIHNFKELIKILGIKGKSLISKKVVVFDLMGNLFKEGYIIRKLLLPLMNKTGNKIDYKTLKKVYVNYSLGNITRQKFRKTVPQEVEEIFLNLIKIDKKLLGIIKSLKKKGYLLGILSNFPKEWGDYLVKKFELDKYFSIIVFSGEYKTRKPNEELYKIFIEKSKARPQNCYFVDDSLINLKEARFLLMKTIWRKKEKQEILFIPDFVIKKVSDLEKIF